MFVGTPLYAISRSNWSPESAEVRPHLMMRLATMAPRPHAELDYLNQRKKDLMTSKIISRSACLAELTSNPKSFYNCPDLHGGSGLPEGGRSRELATASPSERRTGSNQQGAGRWEIGDGGLLTGDR